MSGASRLRWVLVLPLAVSCGQPVTGPSASPSGSAPSASPSAPTAAGLVSIPGGEFVMGDHQGLGGVEHGNDEIPLHRVRVDAFHIGATEVTNADYVAFLNGALGEGSIEVVAGLVRRAGGGEVFCETRGAVSYSRVAWSGSGFSVLDGRESHPMVGVRWFGAAAYANWLTRRAGLAPGYDLTTGSCDLSSRGYRLPTEAEWEYAARGGLADPYRLFPWGDDPDPARANWPGSGDPFEAGSYPWTTPVGFYDGQLRRKAAFAWPSSAESYQTANGANG